MAMNASTLRSAIAPDLKSEIISSIAAVRAIYENIPDDNRLSGYDMATYDNAIWEAVANSVAKVVSEKMVAHIQAFAIATGADSRGDSHMLSIV